MGIEPVQRAARAITQNHLTASPSSSSSNNHLGSASQDNASDFIDEYSMISGSHSSTLERLYAWERKLHDEVEVFEFPHLLHGFLFMIFTINPFSSIFFANLIHLFKVFF